MAFISNAENFTLGDGVYYNVHGSIIHTHNHIYGSKRGREEIEDESGASVLPLIEQTHKRRRLEGAVERGLEAAAGLEIIDQEDLGLINQIGTGPGYLLHAGRNKKRNRAVTVKVFNNGPSTRQQLELEVTLFKGLLHPNIPRLQGISSSTSSPQFIAYEEFRWKQAKGPLATALQSRVRSIELGFKMVADISAGLSYISMQQLNMGPMTVQNFDVFLDVDDRFLILINPRLDETDVPGSQAPQEDSSWALFNGLCHKLLLSANRILHNEGIDRSPALLPPSSTPTLSSSPSLSIGPASASQNEPENTGSTTVDPRREYVWRAMDRGDQSLATIADEMTANLDTVLERLHRLTRTDGQNPHRCAGYVREEITLAPTVVNSALVAHDTPSPLEVCSICHEVVGFQEKFRCICADSGPGLQHTLKCKVCKVWSHSQCVGNVKSDFTCEFCEGEERDPSEASPPLPTPPQRPMGLPPSFTLDDTLSSPSEEPLAPGLFLLPRDAPPDLFKLRSHPRADLPSIKSLFPSSYIPYSERDSSGASSLLPVPKPQRKCASCNTRESSEWRPGPDGPRTLCDPCGLYYAELLLKRNKVGGRISQTMLYVHRPDSLPPRRSRRKRAALVTLS